MKKHLNDQAKQIFTQQKEILHLKRKLRHKNYKLKKYKKKIEDLELMVSAKEVELELYEDNNTTPVDSSDQDQLSD